MILRRVPIRDNHWAPTATVYWPEKYDYMEATRWVFKRFRCVEWTSNYSCKVMP